MDGKRGDGSVLGGDGWEMRGIVECEGSGGRWWVLVVGDWTGVVGEMSGGGWGMDEGGILGSGGGIWMWEVGVVMVETYRTPGKWSLTATYHPQFVGIPPQILRSRLSDCLICRLVDGVQSWAPVERGERRFD